MQYNVQYRLTVEAESPEQAAVLVHKFLLGELDGKLPTGFTFDVIPADHKCTGVAVNTRTDPPTVYPIDEDH